MVTRYVTHLTQTPIKFRLKNEKMCSLGAKIGGDEGFVLQILIQEWKMAHCRSKIMTHFPVIGDDSSVRIATGYGLDGRGSILGRCKICLFSIASGANTASCTTVTRVYFPRGKAAGTAVPYVSTI
jgi:hypothetical protein